MLSKTEKTNNNNNNNTKNINLHVTFIPDFVVVVIFFLLVPFLYIICMNNFA